MRGSILAAALALIASPLAAQTSQTVPIPLLGPALFISPSGQPFRSVAGQPYPVVQWFHEVDKNGDGRLDRAEFRADAEAFFHVLDRNHDGVIDAFEVADYEQQIAPEILGAYRLPDGRFPVVGASQGRPAPQRGRKAPVDAASLAVAEGATPYELTPDPEPVTAADTLQDGRITLAEFIAAADRRFDRLDKKGLGYLTLADLPKTIAQTAAEAARQAVAASASAR